MSKATRRKADAQPAPQTQEEAAAMIAQYVARSLELERLRLDAADQIAAIEAVRDVAAAPIDEELKDQFRALKAWWALAGPVVTGGRFKSIELAGAQLGERTTPPSLRLGGKKEDELILELQASGLEALVRTKHSLDRPAILKALCGGDAPTLQDLGFTAQQREEFFIDYGSAHELGAPKDGR